MLQKIASSCVLNSSVASEKVQKAAGVLEYMILAAAAMTSLGTCGAIGIFILMKLQGLKVRFSWRL